MWEPRFDPHTHAHHSDPDTSHDAARAAQGLVEQRKAAIAAMLLFYGPLTSAEIAGHCDDLDYHEVARRISDLKRDGKVIDTGTRRASPGGRKAAVWQIT